MASTIYVRIENTLHKKVIRCLWNIDAQYGIPHRHSDALKALQDHQILYATHFFACWLDGAKTMIGIRIPIDHQLAHLQFHAYLEQTHLSVVDVSMQPSFYRGLRVEQQQPDEIEIAAAITLRPALGSGGLPLYEVERLKPMPARLALQEERAEIVRTRTRLGRAYLEYALQKAEEESFSIPYARWERIPRESKVKLTFQKREAVKQQARKIQECQQKEATVAITEGNADERQRTICAGKIGSFDPANALLTLIIEKNGMPISLEELERICEKMPKQGNLTYSTLGDLQTQKKALERLERDEVHMADLDLLLYGDNADLSPQPLQGPEFQLLPPEAYLNQHINEKQRTAVTQALATPDFFFLQGPPGTGKTTFIAEMCYQLAKVGYKVLVSSQANLAVDNALSRLESNPAILAIRLGQEERISATDSDFVGDRAVHRWMRSIAGHSKERLESLRQAARLRRLFVDEWETIAHQSSCIVRSQESSRRLAALQQRIRELEKQAAELASGIQVLEQGEGLMGVLKREIAEDGAVGNRQDFWHRLLAFNLWTDMPPCSDKQSGPWAFAERLQRQLADLRALKSACDNELREAQSTYCTIYYRTQQQREVAKDAHEARSIVQTEEQRQQQLHTILSSLRINEHIGETRYESFAYTDLARRIERAQKLVDERVGTALTQVPQRLGLENAIHSWASMEAQCYPREAEMALQEMESEVARLRFEVANRPSYLRAFFSSEGRLSAATSMITEMIRFLLEIAHNFGSYKEYPIANRIWHEYWDAWQRIPQRIEAARHAYAEKEQTATALQQACNTLTQQATPRIQAMEALLASGLTPLEVDLYTTSSQDNPFLAACEKLRYLSARLQTHIQAVERQKTSFASETLEQVRLWIGRQHGHLIAQQARQRRQIQSSQDNMIALRTLLQEQEEEVQHARFDLHRRWRDCARSMRSALHTEEKISFSLYLSGRRQSSDGSIALAAHGDLKNLDAIIRILEDWIETVGENKQGGNGGISPDIWNLFLQSVNVVGATCAHSGTAGFLRNFSEFDVVIVDEVSKATPTELLIPCLLAKKVILVGDHKQLPPVLEEEAMKYIKHIADQASSAPEESKIIEEEITRHLFSSVFKDRFEYLSRQEERLHRTIMLTEQYRMHSDIMDTINQFYNGALQLGDISIDRKRQHGLQIPLWLTEEEQHVVWIDLPKEWKHAQVGKGRENRQEGRLVIQLLHDIFGCWQQIPQDTENLSIGVISMYRKQAERIRKDILHEGQRVLIRAQQEGRLAIGTVDEFQGMEKDIILLSLVVNEPNVKLSNFLCMAERINVAMSRARRLLVIVGSTHNYAEVKSDASEIYRNVLQTVRCRGRYIKADNTWLKRGKP